MVRHIEAGFSKLSGGAALSEALVAALGHGSGARSLHIMVESIAKVDGGWKAVVHAIVEPMPEDTDEEKAPEQARKLRPKHGEEPESEEEYQEKANKKRLHEKLEHDIASVHEEMEHKRRELEHFHKERKEEVHFFIDTVHEHSYQEIAHDFDFAYVHIIAAGPLWEEANRHFPDLDLYEAAHPGIIEKHAPAETLTYKPKPEAANSNSFERELVGTYFRLFG